MRVACVFVDGLGCGMAVVYVPLLVSYGTLAATYPGS